MQVQVQVQVKVQVQTTKKRKKAARFNGIKELIMSGKAHDRAGSVMGRPRNSAKSKCGGSLKVKVTNGDAQNNKTLRGLKLAGSRGLLEKGGIVIAVTNSGGSISVKPNGSRLESHVGLTNCKGVDAVFINDIGVAESESKVAEIRKRVQVLTDGGHEAITNSPGKTVCKL